VPLPPRKNNTKRKEGGKSHGGGGWEMKLVFLGLENRGNEAGHLAISCGERRSNPKWEGKKDVIRSHDLLPVRLSWIEEQEKKREARWGRPKKGTMYLSAQGKEGM